MWLAKVVVDVEIINVFRLGVIRPASNTGSYSTFVKDLMCTLLPC
jgi:hypothetical protein